MHRTLCTFRLWLGVVALSMVAVPAVAETVTLFRVFLNDCTAIVSYGEYARVGDRVIFSMPIVAVRGDRAIEPNMTINLWFIILFTGIYSTQRALFLRHQNQERSRIY